MRIGTIMDINSTSINVELLSSNLIKAREASGKTIEEIISSVNIPASRLKNYEKGKYIPSLPEMESISYVYRIPLLALLGEWDIDQYIHTPDQEQLQHLIEIRQEIISTHLFLAREEVDMSFKDLSDKTGISTYSIKQYEEGEASPPMDELIKLCEVLEININNLIDNESPIGSWQALQSMYRTLRKMPPDLVAFFIQEKNNIYLDLAKQLSMIGFEKFKNLSESLSDFLDTISMEDDTQQS
jgi:transcriptional regulator with XRE-family HTH domain